MSELLGFVSKIATSEATTILVQGESRHRQGPDRARQFTTRAAGRTTVCCYQLFSHSGNPTGSRVVRPRTRRFYAQGDWQPLRDGRWRHAFCTNRQPRPRRHKRVAARAGRPDHPRARVCATRRRRARSRARIATCSAVRRTIAALSGLPARHHRGGAARHARPRWPRASSPRAPRCRAPAAPPTTAWPATTGLGPPDRGRHRRKALRQPGPDAISGPNAGFPAAHVVEQTAALGPDDGFDALSGGTGT